MLEHLKTRWKLTLCSSLFIHLIECSANQIKMGMYQQRNTGGIPSHLVSTANLMPTGDEFKDIDPLALSTPELIQYIHLGMRYINELVQVNPAFTKKIISEQTLSDLCNSKDDQNALQLLDRWAVSDSVVKVVKDFIVWTKQLMFYLIEDKTNDTKTKIAHYFKSCYFKYWRKHYAAAIKKLMDKIQCPHCQSSNYRSHGYTPNGRKRYHCRDCNHYWSPDPESEYTQACGTNKIPFTPTPFPEQTL
ncbi:MAG: hypothetical protein NMK33_00570 [Candidatus Cardinium sp.]|nr:IS1 family transposase [Cardinium endosymbiont of Dermatophagoides farinae]UWW97049.1 MAG: hypothetical protein NMK33_00570 [Candidatus Cardinium sp.]